LHNGSEGGNLRRVTNSLRNDTPPAISPDGKWGGLRDGPNGKRVEALDSLVDVSDHRHLLEPQRANLTGVVMHPRFFAMMENGLCSHLIEGLDGRMVLIGSFPQPYGELYAGISGRLWPRHHAYG
jgi:WD40 repeat protein